MHIEQINKNTHIMHKKQQQSTKSVSLLGFCILYIRMPIFYFA